MPEGTGDRELELSSFRSFMESHVGGSFPALNAFDDARHNLYERLRLVSTSLDKLQSTDDKIDVDLNGIEEVFESLLQEMITHNGDTHELIETSIYLIKGDSDTRVEWMRETLKDDTGIKLLPRDLLYKYLTEEIGKSASVEESIQRISRFYYNDLNFDVEQFLNLLVHKEMHHQDTVTQPEQSEQQATLEIKKSPKEHAVDLAKIAAGVGIALTIDRLFRRGR